MQQNSLNLPNLGFHTVQNAITFKKFTEYLRFAFSKAITIISIVSYN